MREITYEQAANEAIQEEFRRNPRTVHLSTDLAAAQSPPGAGLRTGRAHPVQPAFAVPDKAKIVQATRDVVGSAPRR